MSIPRKFDDNNSNLAYTIFNKNIYTKVRYINSYIKKSINTIIDKKTKSYKPFNSLISNMSTPYEIN